MTRKVLLVLLIAVLLLSAVYAGIQLHDWWEAQHPAYVLSEPVTKTALGFEYKEYTITIKRPDKVKDPYQLTGDTLRMLLERGDPIVVLRCEDYIGLGAWESALKLDQFKSLVQTVLLEAHQWGLVGKVPKINTEAHYYFVVIKGG